MLAPRQDLRSSVEHTFRETRKFGVLGVLLGFGLPFRHRNDCQDQCSFRRAEQARPMSDGIYGDREVRITICISVLYAEF